MEQEDIAFPVGSTHAVDIRSPFKRSSMSDEGTDSLRFNVAVGVVQMKYCKFLCGSAIRKRKRRKDNICESFHESLSPICVKPFRLS